MINLLVININNEFYIHRFSDLYKTQKCPNYTEVISELIIRRLFLPAQQRPQKFFTNIFKKNNTTKFRCLKTSIFEYFMKYKMNNTRSKI